jgi:hypothetical protein
MGYLPFFAPGRVLLGTSGLLRAFNVHLLRSPSNASPPLCTSSPARSSSLLHLPYFTSLGTPPLTSDALVFLSLSSADSFACPRFPLLVVGVRSEQDKLVYHDEVSEALHSGKPIVALEVRPSFRLDSFGSGASRNVSKISR